MEIWPRIQLAAAAIFMIAFASQQAAAVTICSPLYASCPPAQTAPSLLQPLPEAQPAPVTQPWAAPTKPFHATLAQARSVFVALDCENDPAAHLSPAACVCLGQVNADDDGLHAAWIDQFNGVAPPQDEIPAMQATMSQCAIPSDAVQPLATQASAAQKALAASQAFGKPASVAQTRSIYVALDCENDPAAHLSPAVCVCLGRVSADDDPLLAAWMYPIEGKTPSQDDIRELQAAISQCTKESEAAQ